MPQKVCYTVYTMDTGLGGHVFSLNVISNSFSQNFKIVYFGYVKPKVELKNLVFVDLNENSIFNCIKILFKESKGFDLIHSFNEHSYSIARCVSLISKVKLVLNKCGGKNNRYYPKAKSLVVFSKENYDFFKSKKYRPYLIPNRVSPPRVEDQKIFPDNDLCNILCVSRFSVKYKEKIEKSIALLKELNRDKVVATLTLVGTIDDYNTYNSIISKLENNLYVNTYTDVEFTKDAQRHIPYFDLSISAGRSLMESFSYGVPACIVTSDKKFPILVNEKNFESCFYYNFSERTTTQSSENEELETIKNFVSDPDSFKETSDFTQKAFNLYFSSSVVKEKYELVYSESCPESYLNFFDIICNILYIYWIRRNIDLKSLV